MFERREELRLLGRLTDAQAHLEYRKRDQQSCAQESEPWTQARGHLFAGHGVNLALLLLLLGTLGCKGAPQDSEQALPETGEEPQQGDTVIDYTGESDDDSSANDDDDSASTGSDKDGWNDKQSFEHPEALRQGGRVEPSEDAIVEHWEDEYFPFLGYSEEAPFAAPRALKQRSGPVSLEEEVLIPAGPAIIGDDTIPGARPMRTVQLPAFYIDRFEVANVRYQVFVRATDRATPYVHENWAAIYNWYRDSHPKGLGEVPIVMVTWADADAYCRWAGRRLPSEVEWERAARGSGGRTYPWGKTFDSSKANLASRLSGPLADRKAWDRFEKGWTGSKKAEIAPVGSYPEDRTGENIMDMAGNVSEWVAGTFTAYPNAKRSERKGLGTKLRVARGNSWGNRDYSSSMAVRYPYREDRVDSLIGFRCARDAD